MFHILTCRALMITTFKLKAVVTSPSLGVTGRSRRRKKEIVIFLGKINETLSISYPNLENGFKAVRLF